MQKVAVAILVLSALMGMSHAYNTPSFRFPENQLLQCFVQNPFAGQPGQPDSKLEDIPAIPFQPALRGEVYLPLASEFKRPNSFRGGIDEIALNEFVGPELNNQLIAFNFRSTQRTNAVLARSILGVRIDTSSGAAFAAAPGVAQQPSGDRLPGVQEILDYLQTANVITSPAERTIVNDVAVELFRNCSLEAKWQKLPDGYWPPYYSASLCTGRACSLPPGLFCEPDIRAEYILHITVVRWDCCWSLKDLQWRWECGWRKVRIPIISRCYCGCGPRFAGLGFNAVQRLNGVIETSLPNLNT